MEYTHTYIMDTHTRMYIFRIYGSVKYLSKPTTIHVFFFRPRRIIRSHYDRDALCLSDAGFLLPRRAQ